MRRLIFGLRDRFDAWQRRRSPVGFAVAVAKKFGEDRGGSLVAHLSYFGFLSIFPLLLILVTILGFIGNRAVAHSVIGSSLAQFPVLGEQIGKNVAHPLRGSGFGLGVGLLVLLYGALGSAHAAQFAMAEVWNLPRADRPGWAVRMGRAVVLFGELGVGMGIAAGLAGVVSSAGDSLITQMVGFVAAAGLNVALAVLLFRTLTPKIISTTALVRGACVAGGAYTVLLHVGANLVLHQLRQSTAIYGQFGLVLGLLAWISLVVRVGIYAAEINVVYERRLWPRTLHPSVGGD